MKILTIDTSSSSCSVALTDGTNLRAESLLSLDKTVSSRLLQSIDTVLAATSMSVADLDGIAVATGPGSFTGLRVGIATAQGLALAADKPIVGFSSLAMLAMNAACAPYPVCPMFDARKKEVYVGLYQVTPVLQPLLPDRVVDPLSFISSFKEPTVFLGDGAQSYRQAIEQALGKLALFPPFVFHHCRASSGALLAAELFAQGKGCSPAGLQAAYLRPSEAELAKMRRES